VKYKKRGVAAWRCERSRLLFSSRLLSSRLPGAATHRGFSIRAQDVKPAFVATDCGVGISLLPLLPASLLLLFSTQDRDARSQDDRVGTVGSTLKHIHWIGTPGVGTIVSAQSDHIHWHHGM
jgi:hypothetical protein